MNYTLTRCKKKFGEPHINKDTFFAVYGGGGFVGSKWLGKTKLNTIMNLDRDNLYIPHCDIPHQVNSVINFISTVDNYNIFKDPHLDINTNLNTLITILENWKLGVENDEDLENGVFVFISSWFVYGWDSGFGPGSIPISENFTCEPKGFYSITKRTAEQLLISYCETYGLKYKILRLANVLGKDDKKISSKKNALQYLINKIKNNEDIELYDDGQFYRDYIHVDDVARAIDLVIEKGENNQIYNIGNGIPIVFKDVLIKAKEWLGSTSKIEVIQQKEFHKSVQSSRSFYMDNTKLKILGYTPTRDIDSIIWELVK